MHNSCVYIGRDSFAASNYNIHWTTTTTQFWPSPDAEAQLGKSMSKVLVDNDEGLMPGAIPPLVVLPLRSISKELS